MNWTTITAIVCICILTTIAMCKGFDGVAYASSVAVIGGLGGYSIKRLKDRSKEDK